MKLLWWEALTEMTFDYHEMICAVPYYFNASEIKNFDYLAKALWAEKEGLS